MISFKRLLYILLVVILVSGMFMIYNFNEERDTQINTIQKEQEEISWLKNEHLTDAASSVRIVLCGKSYKEPFESIYNNVVSLITDLKIPFIEINSADSMDFMPGDVLVFCSDDLTRFMHPVKLGHFIEDGGRVILAAGIPDGTKDSYLNPFLGVVEKSYRQSYNSLSFKKQLWPFQPDMLTFNGSNSSTWVKLRGNAEIYVEDAEKHVPLFYSYNFGKGKTCVINGTFLSERSSLGFFTGAMCVLYEDFIYPVMGTKSVFLDNFPMVTYVNDALCMKMYGCVTESFVRDTVWPFFQGMGLRTNTVYSSGVLVESGVNTNFPEIHDSLFVTIGKSALQFDGEFIFAGYAAEDGKYIYNEKFMEKFRETFPNYRIQGFAAMSDVFHPDMLHVPNTEFSVVRTDLNEENILSKQDDYYIFPQLSKGNQINSGVLWNLASLHAAYGMVSHTFDVNTLIAEDEKTASWDRDKLELAKFEEDVLSHFSHLKPCTLSHTVNSIESYHALQYAWNSQGNQLKLQVDHAAKGQPFFFHTGKEIKDYSGVAVKEIANGYYLLTVQEEEAILVFNQ